MKLHRVDARPDKDSEILYEIWAHGPLTEAEILSAMQKKSLFIEQNETRVISGRNYRVVKIIAGDGWKVAE